MIPMIQLTVELGMSGDERNLKALAAWLHMLHGRMMVVIVVLVLRQDQAIKI